MKLLELFGGIGACSSALDRLGIEYEIADYVEIDKYAVASYNAIHGTNFEPQDIKEWDKDIKVDLIMHGSPCQDFSVAGKGLGGDKDSGTRSSLMYETIRIVKKLKPKYVIWENVKNLISKKHIHNYRNYINTMLELGYNSYYQVLNSKDYGIPQNRERVFTISIRQDIDNGSFQFPKPFELKLKLKDMLEDNVSEQFFLSSEQISYLENSDYHSNKPSTKVQATRDGICPTLDTMQGGNRQPFIETTNKKLQDTLNGNIDKLKDNSFINSYNKTISNNGMSGTITTGVSFRNETHIAVKSELKAKLCDELIDNDLVKENDMIRHSYTNYRLEKDFRTENSENNNISATLTTRPDTLGVVVKNNTQKGYIIASGGDGIDFEQPNSTTRRGRVQKQISHTLDTQATKGVVLNDLRIRKLTPKECWRLMGFTDQEFDKAQAVNSNAQLYKQAGNSIVVNILEGILEQLLLKDENDFEGQITFEMIGGNK